MPSYCKQDAEHSRGRVEQYTHDFLREQYSVMRDWLEKERASEIEARQRLREVQKHLPRPPEKQLVKHAEAYCRLKEEYIARLAQQLEQLREQTDEFIDIMT